jgi:hypothetical protein
LASAQPGIPETGCRSTVGIKAHYQPSRHARPSRDIIVLTQSHHCGNSSFGYVRILDRLQSLVISDNSFTLEFHLYVEEWGQVNKVTSGSSEDVPLSLCRAIEE